MAFKILHLVASRHQNCDPLILPGHFSCQNNLGVFFFFEGDEAKVFSLIFDLVKRLFNVANDSELTKKGFDLVVGDFGLEFANVDFTRTCLSFLDGDLLLLDVVRGIDGGILQTFFSFENNECE